MRDIISHMPYDFLDKCYAKSKAAKAKLDARRESAKDRVRRETKRRNIELELNGPQPYPISQPPAYRTTPPIPSTIDECHAPPTGYYLYPCISLEELASFIEVDRKVIERIVGEDSERYPTLKATQAGYGRLMGMEVTRRLLDDIHELTGAPVDRVSLLIWMSGSRAMDSRAARAGRDAKPFYEAKIEAEIKRIAALDDPARTIQAQELLERYRDVTAIVKGSKSSEAKSIARERAKVGYDESRRVQFRQALEAIVERTGRKPKHI